MNRLIDQINNMNLEDLEKLKKDLETRNLERLINHRISELKKKRNLGICPVCHTELKGKEQFTLIFGGELKQKASFCGSDCLEYFLYKFKKTSLGESMGLENKSMNIDEE